MGSKKGAQPRHGKPHTRPDTPLGAPRSHHERLRGPLGRKELKAETQTGTEEKVPKKSREKEVSPKVSG